MANTWWDTVAEEIIDEVAVHIAVRSKDENAEWEWDDVDKLYKDVTDRLKSIIDDSKSGP